MICVDQLRPNPGGWGYRNRLGDSCHLFDSEDNLTRLHDFARGLGMKREWFQDHPLVPHYDLTASRRAAAVRAGAVEVSMKDELRRRRATAEKREDGS